MDNTKRVNSFIFQVAYLDAIEVLAKEIQGEAVLAVMRLGIYGEKTVSEHDGINVILAMVEPIITAQRERYERKVAKRN